VPALAVVVIVCLGHVWQGPLLLEPLLAVPPALAGIGARSARQPLIWGGISVLTAIAGAVIAPGATKWLPFATIITVAVVTLISALGAERSARGSQKLAAVTSVAEAAQRALLRPLPRQVGPLELGVVYLAAAAEARVGGDLYEVTRSPYGIRLIIGDVRGKGLGAVEVAADILGVFREVAHEVYTLAEVARRLDASLIRRRAVEDEFVTAVLAEIDPDASRLTIYSCGHPPPLLLPAGPGQPGMSRRAQVLEVPEPAPPLGLLALGDSSGASCTVPFKPGDRLLLYTDGVTEARDAQRRFYPLIERLADPAAAGAGDSGADLLDWLREDLLRHVGAPLTDDAALLLAGAANVRHNHQWAGVAAAPGQPTADWVTGASGAAAPAPGGSQSSPGGGYGY
jgi:serine phosphatase RsbU (regulator of sigma subunit)